MRCPRGVRRWRRKALSWVGSRRLYGDRETREDTLIPNDPYWIRPAGEGDLKALYAIALATGDGGQDASGLHRDPEMVGHIYAAPYLSVAGAIALVAEDDQGVAGYVVGAMDTPSFERRLDVEWWPPLRERFADPTGKPFADWTADEVRAWQIHHPRHTPERLTGRWPSHIHINLLPHLRGRGVGRALLDEWLGLAERQGSIGAHLGVGPANARARRFYQTYGWREQEATARTIWMVFDLPRN